MRSGVIGIHFDFDDASAQDSAADAVTKGTAEESPRDGACGTGEVLPLQTRPTGGDRPGPRGSLRRQSATGRGTQAPCRWARCCEPHLPGMVVPQFAQRSPARWMRTMR